MNTFRVLLVGYGVCSCETATLFFGFGCFISYERHKDESSVDLLWAVDTALVICIVVLFGFSRLSALVSTAIASAGAVVTVALSGSRATSTEHRSLVAPSIYSSSPHAAFLCGAESRSVAGAGGVVDLGCHDSLARAGGRADRERRRPVAVLAHSSEFRGKRLLLVDDNELDAALPAG